MLERAGQTFNLLIQFSKNGKNRAKATDLVEDNLLISKQALYYHILSHVTDIQREKYMNYFICFLKQCPLTLP